MLSSMNEELELLPTLPENRESNMGTATGIEGTNMSPAVGAGKDELTGNTFKHRLYQEEVLARIDGA